MTLPEKKAEALIAVRDNAELLRNYLESFPGVVRGKSGKAHLHAWPVYLHVMALNSMEIHGMSVKIAGLP